MNRFAALIVLVVALAIGLWLALGERRAQNGGEQGEAGSRSSSEPQALDSPEVVVPTAPPRAAAPGAAPSTREAPMAIVDEERKHARHVPLGGDSISGRVVWPDGTAAKASVSAADESEERKGFVSSREGDEQQTSADVSFQISGLGAGPFRIHARGKRSAQEQKDSSGAERKQGDHAYWLCEQEHVEPGTNDLVLTLSSGLELSGRVVDERGAGVDDFKVHAQRKGRTTPMGNATNTLVAPFRGSSGAFVLAGFVPGTWQLRVTARGYADSEYALVDVPSEAPLELVMFHAASVHGIVLDPQGAPIAGARVSAEEDREYTSSRNNGVLPSDERDGFEIDWLLPGKVTLFAQAPGCAPSEPLVLELVPGQVQEGLELRMRIAGTITGEVLGPGGRPEDEVFVHLVEQQGSDYHDVTRTNARGHFELRGVPAGEYSLTANTRGGLQARARITLGEREIGRVRLSVPDDELVKLHGHVTIGGKASERIHLEAGRQDESGASSSKAQCDPDGAYELIVPGAGRYRVSASLYGGDLFSWSTTIDVPQVPEFLLDIAAPLGCVRGRVTNRDGAPIADLAVRTDRQAGDESSHSRTHTDSDGRYELLVSPGSVTVIVGGNDWPWPETATSWTEQRVSDLALAAGQELDGIDFVLSPGGTLAGRVRRSDGGSVGRVLILDYGRRF
jgi:carboxypeptidase family protein